MGEGIARKRNSDEKAQKEPYRVVQGEGGGSSDQGRQDARGAGSEVRCAYQSDHAVEDPAAGGGHGGVSDPGGEARERGAECEGHAGDRIGQLALENDFLAGALGRIDGASAKK